MLFTIAVILLVLWLLGLVSGYTMGNFIYVLLVIALVLFVAGLVSGRRVVVGRRHDKRRRPTGCPAANRLANLVRAHTTRARVFPVILVEFDRAAGGTSVAVVCAQLRPDS